MFDKDDFNDAPAWRPEPGDVISGKVITIDSRDGGYGEYSIVTVETADGPFAIHAFHVSLANQMAERDVQVGDEIGVLYSGKVENKKTTGFHHGYKVKKASGAPQPVDWAKLAPDADLNTDPGPDVPIDLPTPPTVIPVDDEEDLPF